MCRKTRLGLRAPWIERELHKLIFNLYFLFLKRAAFLAAFSILTIGCGTVAKKSVKGVGKIAGKTIKIAGKSTGELAAASVKAGGGAVLSVGKLTGKSLIELAKSGRVTFVDLATGLVSSVPFVDGMNRRLALKAAELDSRHKFFEIIRPNGVIKAGWSQLVKVDGVKLKSADVIRIVSTIKK